MSYSCVIGEDSIKHNKLWVVSHNASIGEFPHAIRGKLTVRYKLRIFMKQIILLNNVIE